MFTKFLIQHFIPNWQDTNHEKVRKQYGYLGGIVGLIANITLFLTKLILGVLINSISLIADGLNNLSDVGSSIISLLGFKLSSKPADKEHPLGHGKTEYISALIISFIILFLGFELIQNSIDRILNPSQVKFSWISVILLLIAIALKLWMGLFNRTLGKMIHSKSLAATAVDSLSDVFSTSIVLISILVSPFVSIPIDGYMGIFVSIIILYNGFSLIKDTLNSLLGEAPDPELMKQIEEMVLCFDGIKGIHDLIIHDYGPNRTMATLHAEVSDQLSPVVAHEIVDAAERKVSRELNVFLVIHTDPLNFNCEMTNQLYNQIKTYLSKIPLVLSFHDFRVVDDHGNKNIIFEVVVKEDLSKEEMKSLKKQIKEDLKLQLPDYQFIITLERQHTFLH
ncbi:cation diffusion facilitator family transporter [Garciella nitratireducens]|uniref:cation diffusion facilitator family transporter n=1 Tax=Garciella nitratireducens TaxID=218205 RepID=UPI000DE93FAF|nr:cation diffusion facilitator family transporter [Garciella nitratireducens]RBP41549.1 cation diffusion facilitator family transporter [Garciella nitratireducens]